MTALQTAEIVADLLIGAIALMFLIVLDLRRDADAMATRADIRRIEEAFDLDGSRIRPLLYAGRHRAGEAQGTIAQRERLCVEVQRWNAYTQPLPILEALDAIGITAPVKAWPARQTPTDLAAAYELFEPEPAPVEVELFLSDAIGRPPYELVAIGGRR